MKLRFLLLFSSTLFSMAKADELKLDYALYFTEPQAHYVNVSMTVSGLAREQLDLKMAVWAPGSYLIREFPKNVEGFRALAGIKELQSEKISKNRSEEPTSELQSLLRISYAGFCLNKTYETIHSAS